MVGEFTVGVQELGDDALAHIEMVAYGLELDCEMTAL
ncbi:hypothetical protein ES702_06091 [subsurface metagenome]